MRITRWLTLLALLMVVSQLTYASTYEEVFTEKAGRAYSEDINVWVYTSEFAKRFAMPKEWVDDDLKGAYALAFRVETRSNRTKFPHKGPNVSIPNRDCILDVYVDKKVPIPWVDNQIADFRFYTPNSPTYLLPQTEKDIQWRRQPIGIKSPGDQAREPLVYMGVLGYKTGGSLRIRQYDKKIYPGVSYISLYHLCMTPPKEASWIEFMKDGDWNHVSTHQNMSHIASKFQSFLWSGFMSYGLNAAGNQRSRVGETLLSRLSKLVYKSSVTERLTEEFRYA